MAKKMPPALIAAIAKKSGKKGAAPKAAMPAAAMPFKKGGKVKGK